MEDVDYEHWISQEANISDLLKNDLFEEVSSGLLDMETLGQIAQQRRRRLKIFGAIFGARSFQRGRVLQSHM